MTISFVIPAYNEERTIGRCLHSVLRESRRCGHDVEVIVVDNACTDCTAAIASSYPGVRVVREPRKGLLFARQAGFLASRGDLLACVDADTILTRGWIAHALRAFRRNPRLAALTGPYFYYDLSSVTQLFVILWYICSALLFGYIAQHLVRRSAMLQGGNYVVRRTALERIGGYDTSISFYGEDTDLANRIVTTGVVRFTFRFRLLASGRRLKKEGVIATGSRYAINGFSMFVHGRPATHRYTDIR
jgi:cellulose synthase/poly-beta-1,6-N-acetylglucosamine synthase-like glycosyltransferase